MFEWVIANKLARSRRPGYSGEKGTQVPREVVDAWLIQARREGILSIICLLDDDHLCLYVGLPDGLVSYYASSGFSTRHVRAADRQFPPLSGTHLAEVWQAYNELPKPVVVHCSAGVDRTGQAVRWICSQLAESPSVGMT